MGLGKLLKRLVGGGASEPPAAEAVEYRGYRIAPTPMAQGGQFLTAGVIIKETPEGRLEHRFIRADTHASAELASQFSVQKAKQIIDQLGDRIFQEE